tara:strand:- start:298 stop:441 length:144 start_codon:yes stop_codon:yes gene_type:complete
MATDLQNDNEGTESNELKSSAIFNGLDRKLLTVAPSQSYQLGKLEGR